MKTKLVSNAKYGQPVEEGTIFNTKISGTQIAIHRIIHLDGWFLSCARFGIQDKELEADSITGAIVEAKTVLKEYADYVKKIANQFNSDPWEITR